MGVNLKLLTVGFVGLFVVFALALFLGAGTVFWPAGWAFLVLFFGADAALGVWLLRHDPGLLKERMSGFGKPVNRLGIKSFSWFCKSSFWPGLS